MRRIVMIIALLSVAAFGYAQPNGGGRPDQEKPKPPSAKEMIKKATKELNLDQDQVKQWEAIFKKYGKPSDDPEKGEETRKAITKELEATLNSEQLEKFKEMEKQRPPRPNKKE